MKRILLVLLIVASGFSMVIAQPKIAVLDATVGGGIHINAASIVADTINEQFVKSPDYTAIDRAYISNIQEEKKFQLSGEVNDADIKELGFTFGADYLCIANVSLLGATYTVSARLIRVETAEVVSQESARSMGTIDILFEVAEEVGRKLVGARTDATRTAQPAAAKPQTAPAQAEPKTTVPAPEHPAKQAEKQKPRPKSHVTLSYMMPGYLGSENTAASADGSSYGFQEADLLLADNWGSLLSESDLTSWGIDGHILLPFWLFYLSGGFTYTSQEIYALDYLSNEYYWDNFSTTEIYTGLGAIYPVAKNIQVYMGMTLGFILFTLGEDYDGEATDSFWLSPGADASGVSLGFELGADYTLGPLCLSIRYKVSHSGYLEGEEVFTAAHGVSGDNSFGHHGLVLGAGLAW